jgi:dTDP-4-amino-4,6-dideoxygalactose transaminase
MVSDQIGPGSQSRELARQVANYLEISDGVGCSSYHTAIELALDALGVQARDKLIISPLAPVNYLTVLEQRGLIPLLADVDPESGTVQLESISGLLNENPKAIIIHYTLGFIPDMEAIASLGLPVVEDLSQGLGGLWRNRKCGGFGDLVILSLRPDGIITGGEGGLVLAGSRRLLKELRESGRGTLHPLSDLNASLGVAQMREIETFLASRREIAKIFDRSLMRSRHKPMVQKGEGENIPFSFPVLLETGMNEIRAYARKRNIETIPAFADSVIARGNKRDHCPNARQIMLRCLLFPCYPMLGKTNVEHVSKVIASLP